MISRPRGSLWKGGILAAAIVVALLAGCRGGGGTSPDGGSAAGPTASPATVVVSNALPLERFQYTATLTLQERSAAQPRDVVISTDGTFQAPDRHAFTYTTRFGGGMLAESAVIIGDQVWVRESDAPWRQTTLDDEQADELLGSAFTTIRPNFLGGPEFDGVRESVRRLPSSDELVNGVLTQHYDVGPAGQEFFRTFLGGEGLFQAAEGIDWELWLADEGAWPVRLLIRATINADLAILDELGLVAPTSWVLRIDLSRPNDPTLTVLAPDGG